MPQESPETIVKIATRWSHGRQFLHFCKLFFLYLILGVIAAFPIAIWDAVWFIIAVGCTSTVALALAQKRLNTVHKRAIQRDGPFIEFSRDRVKFVIDNQKFNIAINASTTSAGWVACQGSYRSSTNPPSPAQVYILLEDSDQKFLLSGDVPRCKNRPLPGIDFDKFVERIRRARVIDIFEDDIVMVYQKIIEPKLEGN